MLTQVFNALITVVVGVGVAVFYFWGVNWLLDRLLVSAVDSQGRALVGRDRLRSQIRPWVFLFPALLFMTLYLVYPVFETLRLSFFNRNGNVFIGFANYLWAINNDVFRQSVFNNLLWLIIVPTFSTVFGLLVAVLADRLWWGNIAKSLIFMPMAISFVGASVIWKFVYDYRGVEAPQIGAVNAIIQFFGGEPQAWMTVPFWNSVLLMVILIWIQTGFAMVILSAALRGIPEETIEAAKIDGASPIRTFFDIQIPQIFPTILVVWTTITIVVLKVFDIVLAMTNGQWNTQVLANLMFDWMFRGGGDFGRGSTIAICIMIAVVPIMIWNVRQASREEGTR